MKLNELIIALCKKECVASEAATAIIYAGSILVWTGIDSPKDQSRAKTKPALEQHAQGCPKTAHMLQLNRPL